MSSKRSGMTIGGPITLADKTDFDSSAGMASRSILILVITYSSSTETEETIRSIEELAGDARAAYPNLEIVVWDNKSCNVAHQGIVQYHSSPKGNIGFGAAVNAVRRIYGFDRILLLNPDVDLTPNTLLEIVTSIASLPTEAIWAPSLLNSDGSVQTAKDSLYMRTPLQEIMDIFGFPAQRQLRRDPLYYLRGAVFSISREMLDLANGFDEDFFLYGEEADLCFRLAGASQLVLDEEIRIIHHGSQGYKGKSMQALDYSLQARVLLHRKFNGPLAGVMVLLGVRLLKTALGTKRLLRAAARNGAAIVKR